MQAMPEADVEEAVPVAQRIRLCRSPLECFQVGEEVRLDPESGKDCCTPWCILLAAWHLISFLGAFCVFLMIMPLFAKQKPFIPMPKFVEGSYFPTARISAICCFCRRTCSWWIFQEHVGTSSSCADAFAVRPGPGVDQLESQLDAQGTWLFWRSEAPRNVQNPLDA